MVGTFDDQTLRAICDVLGDSSDGLTGGEISRLLADCGIEDPFPTGTKRHRSSEALAARQKGDGCGNAGVADGRWGHRPGNAGAQSNTGFIYRLRYT